MALSTQLPSLLQLLAGLSARALTTAGAANTLVGAGVHATFLLLNGKKLTASQANATLALLGVASSEMSEAEFAGWVRLNSKDR